MLKKILLLFIIFQCSTFFVVEYGFAVENELKSDIKNDERNIALVGNFVANQHGLEVLDSIEKNDPEHIFFLGDLGYDSPDSWFTFVDKLGKEKISVVIGNHDKDDANEFLAHYGLDREFYSIDYENIHFIILSSDLDYTKDSEQRKFLENDLKMANNNPDIKWKIVLIHKPMIYKDYYVKNDPSLTNGIALAEGLQPVLDAYDVDMIISGHVHLYERSFPLKFNNVITSNEKTSYIDPDGAIHVIVGTAGADKHHNQYPQTFENWAVVKNPDVYGFFNLRIPEDKDKLIFEFITNEGYVLDKFQIFESNDSFKNKLNVFPGADLSGADLSNADLSGADLSNADLSGADLSNADLSFSNLKNIDFSNVKIKNVKLIGVTFTDMDLSEFNLSKKNLIGSSFLRVNLSETNFEGSNLSWTSFESVNLFNTNFKYAKLFRVNLSGADLSNVNLEYSNLKNSDLSKIDFSNVKLTNVSLEKTILSYSNFSNVDLSGMNLAGADLYGIHLHGKDLRNTNLKNANFIGYKIDDEKWWDYLGLQKNGGAIDLAGVDRYGEKLYATDLSRVDLRKANLSGVDLTGVDVSHANLANLDLSDTKIERSNLSKTNLSGADLSGKNLSQVNLSGADLSNADLSGADFTDMNFFRFQFFGTDLSGADQVMRIYLVQT